MSAPDLRPVRSAWRTLGWPGVAGALALSGAAVVAGGKGPDQAAQVEQAPVLSAPTMATLPPMRAVPPVAERLAQLLELALREGVSVQRAEQRSRGGGEPGTQLNMPASGRYADLRRFVEAALLADPDLALESLRLRRGETSDDVLEAQFVWWMGGARP